MTETNLSRRGFLTLGTVAAATAAAGIAGCAPSTNGGSEASLSQTGASGANDGPSFMQAPEPIDPSSIAETHDYDVVVVGAGTAGVPAAISAHKNGASVCVVQKELTPISQGNTATGVKLEGSDEAAIQYLITRTLGENQYRSKRALLDLWAHRSGEAIEYMAEYSQGMENAPTLSKNDRYPDGYLPVEYPGTDLKVLTFSMRCGVKPICWQDGITTLAQAAEANGIDFFYETPGVQLVQDDHGVVTGVICQAKNGDYVQFNAAKGVVVATGDYQNDEEMVAYYLPDMTAFDKKQMNKTGDGHKMILWAGGQMERVGHTKMVHDFDSGPMFDEPFMAVKLSGERFCDEFIDMSLINNFLIEDEKPGYYCQIFDANYMQDVEDWGGKPTDPEALAMYMPEEDIAERTGVRPDLIATFKADSLDELATKLGITDTAAFKAAVERYNELCAKGADDDFGKDPKYLKPVAQAPFYGIQKHVRLSAIVSGVNVDEELRALREDGSPIEGLYVAGNTAGQFYSGVDYPLSIAGLSIGRAITFGYVAGENAALR